VGGRIPSETTSGGLDKPGLRKVPGPGAWVVGVPIGLLLWVVLASVAVLHRPDLAISGLHRLTAGSGSLLHADRIRIDKPDGWSSPTTWVLRVEGLFFRGVRGRAPSLLVDEVEVGFPTWALLGDGDVDVPHVRVHGATLAWVERVRPKGFTPRRTWPRRLVIERAEVQGFDLVMAEQDGLIGVVVEDAGGLVAPFVFDFGTRDMQAAIQARAVSVDLGGVVVRDVRAPSFAFAGQRMILSAEATIAGAPFDGQLELAPLTGGPPTLDVSAHLPRADLGALLRATVGEDLGLRGHVKAHGRLHIPPHGRLPDMQGMAVIDAQGVHIALPDSLKQGLVGAMDLVDFMQVDPKARTLDLGPVGGRVDLQDGALVFTELYYIAPREVGRIDGSFAPGTIDVRVRFQPKAGSGALPWGFTLSGPTSKPRFALIATGRHDRHPVGPHAPGVVREAYAAMEAEEASGRADPRDAPRRSPHRGGARHHTAD